MRVQANSSDNRRRSAAAAASSSTAAAATLPRDAPPHKKARGGKKTGKRSVDPGDGGVWVPCVVPYVVASDFVGPARRGAGGWFLGQRQNSDHDNNNKNNDTADPNLVEVHFDDGPVEAIRRTEVVDLREAVVGGVQCWVFASTSSSSEEGVCLMAKENDIYCQLDPPTLAVGDLVYGRYRNNVEGRYYRGRIAAVCHSTSTPSICTIVYDDGDVECNVPYGTTKDSHINTATTTAVRKVVAHAHPDTAPLAWLDDLPFDVPSKQRPNMKHGTLKSLSDRRHKVQVHYSNTYAETWAAVPVVKHILDEALAQSKTMPEPWPANSQPTATTTQAAATKVGTAAASKMSNNENGHSTPLHRKNRATTAVASTLSVPSTHTGAKKAPPCRPTPLATVYEAPQPPRFAARLDAKKQSNKAGEEVDDNNNNNNNNNNNHRTPLPPPTPVRDTPGSRDGLRRRAASAMMNYSETQSKLNRDLDALLRDPDNLIPYSAPRHRQGIQPQPSPSNTSAADTKEVTALPSPPPAPSSTPSPLRGQRTHSAKAAAPPPHSPPPEAAVASPLVAAAAPSVPRPKRRGRPPLRPAAQPPLAPSSDEDGSNYSDSGSDGAADKDEDWNGDGASRVRKVRRKIGPCTATAATNHRATIAETPATFATKTATPAATTRHRKRENQDSATEARRPPVQRRRRTDDDDHDESGDDDNSVTTLQEIQEERCLDYMPHESYVHPAPSADAVHLMPTTLSDKFHKALTSSATKWASDLAKLVHGFHQLVPTDDCISLLLTFLCRGPHHNITPFPDPCMVDFVQNYVSWIASDPGMSHYLAQRVPDEYWDLCLQQLSAPYYAAPGDEGRTNHHSLLRQWQSLHAKGACAATFLVLLRSQVDACVKTDDPSSLLESRHIIGDVVHKRRGPKTALERFVRATARLWVHHGHLQVGDADLTQRSRGGDPPSECAVRAAQRSASQLLMALGQVCTHLAWVYRTTERETARCVAGVVAHAFGVELRESTFDPTLVLERLSPDDYRECLKLEFVESLGRDLVPQLRPYVAQGLGIVPLWNELHGTPQS